MATIEKLQRSRKGAGPQNSAQETKAVKVEGGDCEGVQVKQVEEHVEQVKGQVKGQMEVVEEVQIEVQQQVEVVQVHVKETEEAKLQQAVLMVEEGKNDMQVGQEDMYRLGRMGRVIDRLLTICNCCNSWPCEFIFLESKRKMGGGRHCGICCNVTPSFSSSHPDVNVNFGR